MNSELEQVCRVKCGGKCGWGFSAFSGFASPLSEVGKVGLKLPHF